MKIPIDTLSKLSRHLLPKQLDSIARGLAYRMGKTSFSQEGEDMILSRYFEGQNSGFYIDIGAHHPFRYSNTCIFSRKGWKGINIDATPGAMREFKKFRKKDINIESGVGAEESAMPFFVFSEPALNTFDPILAEQRVASSWKIEKTIEVGVAPLRSLLEQYLPAAQQIDFLSIDVEGRDLEVLQSNDWEKFRPRVVLVETMSPTIKALGESSHHHFLSSLDYVAIAKSINTSFYADKRSKS